MVSLLILFALSDVSYGNSIGGSDKDLMSCTRFHFEEKVLEKVIRNELTVQMNQVTMAQWEKRIDEKLKHIDDRTKEILTEFETKLSNLLTQADTTLKTNITKFEDDVSVKFQEIDYKTGTKLAELELDIDEKLKLMDKTLHKDIPLELDLHKKKVNSLIFNLTSLSENISSIIMNKQDVALKDFERNVSLMNAGFHKTLTTNENKLNTLIERINNETQGQQQSIINMYRDLQLNYSLLSIKLTEQQDKANELLTSYIGGKNRVAVTACAPKQTVKSGTQLQFTDVTTKNGISNAALLKLTNTGTFTSENAGVYLIAVFITTSTHGIITRLYKNDKIIASMIFSLNGNHQTNSVTVIIKLEINDRLYVKADYNQDIIGFQNGYSCMSILQITE